MPSMHFIKEVESCELIDIKLIKIRCDPLSHGKLWFDIQLMSAKKT